MRYDVSRIVGAIGTLVYLAIFIRTPSFPTPDKILVFATFAAMAFGQARELLKRFVPFVALLLVYESFRGLVPHLNAHVNYGFMPAADKLLFLGHLPTKLLQNVLWHGHVQWYDFVFYGAYTLHFVLPFALAVLIWKTREKHYWRFIAAYLVVSFAGFLTYLAFPAAPPWLASDKGLIEPIARVSSAVWAAFGIHDFPSVYNKIAPNPVAAMPSLHAAYATLFALFITKLYRPKRRSRLDARDNFLPSSGRRRIKDRLRGAAQAKIVSGAKTISDAVGSAGRQADGAWARWRWLAWVYPLLIWVGTTYMGEHYVIDIIAGILYAILGYMAAPYVVAQIQKFTKRLLQKYEAMVK